MSGETDRARLLAGMDPHLDPEGPYVVATLAPGAAEPAGAIARVEEDEGTTIVAPAAHAEGEFPCARITLRVHSALDAVGFLASVTTALADAGISTNPLAGRHHDHLLVPWERRHEALAVLRALTFEDVASRASNAGDATSRALTTLRAQFDLVWALAEYHLDRLTPDELLAEPAARCWTVRRGPDGAWRPDVADTEPDPVPVPTAAWVTWHLGWWWSGAIASLSGRTPPAREEVTWPGDADDPAGAVVTWLRGLRERWVTVLDGVDENAEAPFPWPPGSGRTVADTLAWANAELMKNVAELGQLRLLHAARE